MIKQIENNALKYQKIESLVQKINRGIKCQ